MSSIIQLYNSHLLKNFFKVHSITGVVEDRELEQKALRKRYGRYEGMCLLMRHGSKNGKANVFKCML